MKRIIKKIINFFVFVLEPCNSPYDCPFCMHCYNNPKDIEE